MADRPILFSAPMVRALLAGTKTQTRRPVKGEITTIGSMDYLNGQPLEGCGATLGQCRFKVGDRLWVRETFSGSIAYERHGYPLREWGNKVWYWADGNPTLGDWTRPRPSIHMPRTLSRITLEVTGVRVERLLDISRGDAMDEGCPFPNMAQGPDPRQWYADLWESINGAGSWAANPWVWCVAFRRAKHG